MHTFMAQAGLDENLSLQGLDRIIIYQVITST